LKMKPIEKINPKLQKNFKKIIEKILWKKKLRQFQYWQMWF
jgi:hypothetical protein